MGRARFQRTSDVHRQVTATHVLAVHAADCGLSFLTAGHLDKAETFGSTAVAFHHHFGRLNMAKGRKLLLQIFIANRVRQVANIKFVAHFGAFQKKRPAKNRRRLKRIEKKNQRLRLNACAPKGLSTQRSWIEEPVAALLRCIHQRAILSFEFRFECVDAVMCLGALAPADREGRRVMSGMV